MDETLKQLLSSLLQNLGFAGGMDTPVYRGGQGYYYGNITDYKPGFVKQFFQSMAPGIQLRAPQNMTMSSWMDILSRSQQRRQLESAYSSYNPLAVATAVKGLAASKLMSQKEAKSLFLQGGAPTALASMLTMGWNMFAAPMLGDELPDKGRQASLLYDSLSGLYFGGQGGHPMLGLRTKEVEGVVNRLSKRAYKDEYGLVKKGRFNLRELVDISRMGADYGMFTGASAKELPQKVEQLSEVVATGLSVYGTLYKNMKKEDVIKRIMDLTAGTLPLSNTVNSQQLLLKVDAFAKAAGVSVEAMHRLMSEGARVFNSMQYTGQTGALSAATTSVLTQLSGVKLGPGQTAVLTPQMIRAVGGQGGVQAVLGTVMASFHGSDMALRSRAAYQLAKQTGVSETVLQQHLQKMFSPDAARGKGLQPADIETLVSAIAAQTVAKDKQGRPISEQALLDRKRRIRTQLQENQQLLTNQFMEDMQRGRVTVGGQVKSELDIQQQALIQQYTSATFGLTPNDERYYTAPINELTKGLAKDERRAKAERIRTDRVALAIQHYKKTFNMSEAEARVAANWTMDAIRANPEGFKAARRHQAEVDVQTLRTQFFEERVRPEFRTPMERILNMAKGAEKAGLGNILSIVLPQEDVFSLMLTKGVSKEFTQKYEALPEGTKLPVQKEFSRLLTEDLAARKKAPTTEELKEIEGNLRKQALFNIAFKKTAPWHANKELLGLYGGISLLTGESGFTVAGGMAKWKDIQEAVDLSGTLSTQGARDRATEVFESSGKQLDSLRASFKGYMSDKEATTENFNKFTAYAQRENLIARKGVIAKQAQVQGVYLKWLKEDDANKYGKFEATSRRVNTAINLITSTTGSKVEDLAKTEFDIVEKWLNGKTLTPEQQAKIASMYHMGTFTPFSEFSQRSQKNLSTQAEWLYENLKQRKEDQVTQAGDIRGVLLMEAQKAGVTSEEQAKMKRLFRFEEEGSLAAYMKNQFTKLKAITTPEGREKFMQEFAKDLQGRVSSELAPSGAATKENIVKFLQTAGQELGVKGMQPLYTAFKDEIKKAKDFQDQKLEKVLVDLGSKLLETGEDTAKNTEKIAQNTEKQDKPSASETPAKGVTRK